MRLAVTLIGAAALVACNAQERVLSTESIGRVVDAQVIQTSFNESIKTQIKTERRYLVVYGTVSIALGEEAFIVRTNRRTCFQVGESGRCYLTR